VQPRACPGQAFPPVPGLNGTGSLLIDRVGRHHRNPTALHPAMQRIARYDMSGFMVDRPQSSRDPTQDVLDAIQEVIDAPHLPFPDANPLWKTAVKGARDDTTDARVAQLEELIEYVQRDIAEIKTDLGVLRRSDLHLALAVVLIVAIAVAVLLAKVFHWL
jgi:hypothetical protein